MKIRLLVCATLCLALPGFSNDWPHFRGPDRTGTVETKNLFGNTFGLKVDWKKELGSGYASISVAGDVAVTMYSDETSNILAAYNTADGSEKWRYVFGPVYKGHSGSDDGPTGTPTIYGDMVYALDPYGILVAVTLDEGKKQWERRLGEDLKARVPHYGFNTVPAVMDEKLILMTGDKENRAITALDRKTGKEIWASGADTTTYQSPFIWENKGEKRILAMTDTQLMELDPKDGRVIWQAEHGVLDNESYGMPLFVGENRVLITDRRKSAAFELNLDGENTIMKELWRSNIISRTYAIPVYHNGYIYGFKSQFLACIDPATGEPVWRSRPPGGRGLVLLDGHLIIIGNDGRLVAVEATHEAYREKASVQLFDEGSYTAVSFAGGNMYARNLKEMARISITDQVTMASVEKGAGPELQGKFGEWIGIVMKASNKQEMVNAFVKENKQFPILEGNMVHYFYQGDHADVSVARGFEEDKPMHRLEGTDLFFLTETLAEDGHWEYHYAVFGDRVKDPLNPHVITVPGGERYELRMPKWKVPNYLGEPTGPRGRLEKVTVKSEIRKNEREIQVYLPAGYDKSKDRYPMVVFNSETILESGNMDRCLDHLIGKTVAPVIAVFMPHLEEDQEFVGPNRDDYIRFLTEELTPYMDANYRTRANAQSRAVSGIGRGAVVSTLAALRNPQVFGKLGVQSFVFLGPVKEDLKAAVNGAKPGVDVFVSISTNDYNWPGIQAEPDSRELVKTLKEKGLSVKSTTHGGAPGWASWRAQFGPMLESLCPKDQKDTM